jgi:uncharacterized protein YcgL (UPF0745 family)
MNSWNNSTAPAFNLKVYNVIPRELQDNVYEVIQTDEYWDKVKDLISDFQVKYDYRWQAGFNGRSGGYLVLYKGGKKDGMVFSYPGKSVDFEEVPKEVLNDFKQLAIDIVELAISYAKNYEVVEEEYRVTRTRKTIKEKEKVNEI